MDRIELVLEKMDRAAAVSRSVAESTDIKRQVYGQLSVALAEFVASSRRRTNWIIMPGLRGVGKTTLLAQLYNDPQIDKQPHKFYLSLDDPITRGMNYDDLVAAIERRLGMQLHEVDKPLFLFVDEVHFWGGNWSADFKFLYDNCRWLFLVCTGSSALHLNLSPDSARRSDLVRIPPLSLVESVSLSRQASNPKQSPVNTNGLGSSIYQSLFESANAAGVYDSLQSLQSEIDNCWQKLTQAQPGQLVESIKTTIDQYVNHCLTLPTTIVELAEKDSITAVETAGPRNRIRDTLGLVLERDMDTIRNFDNKTKGAMFDFLCLLAHSDTISLNNISRYLSFGSQSGLAIDTIRAMLKALKQAEILTELPAWGSAFGRATKPSKYLFAAPALRSSLSPLSDEQPGQSDSQRQQFDQLRGRLLEDAVAMGLKRSLPPTCRLSYDARAGGADFIVTIAGSHRQTIALEVGWQKHSQKQVDKTVKRVKPASYGLVISGAVNRPRLSPDGQVVYLPLTTFLLI